MDKRQNTIDFLEFPADGDEAFARSKKFYSRVFGWAFNERGDDYIDTSDSGLSFGVNGDPAHRPNKPLAVIYTDDIAATEIAIVSAGGTVTKETFEFPGGRRFHFTDPAGNELAVWTDM